MRIALVHRRFTTSGGTERWLVGFVAHAVAAGHEVTVLCNEVRADLRATAGVTFVHLPMIRAARQLSLRRAASRALARGRFDAVMGFGRTTGHHLFRAGGGSHASYLRRMHPWRRRLWPGDWIETALDRAAVRSAKVVVANSKLGADGLARDYGAARVEVVYNGVDLRRFRPDPDVRAAVRAGFGAEGRIALFLGTGFRRKGLDVAIEALPPDWALWVVGRDPAWSAPDRVRFLGERHDPERLLQAADAMILPTRYDPFANACLEALASGVPPLTTPDNGASEILPFPWMVCRDAAEFRTALSRVEPGVGEECRRVAATLPAERCYGRTLELLAEAAR